MRLKCVACDVLARPVYFSAARSSQIVDVTLHRFGLHLTPGKLRETLQTEIDSVGSAGIYDAVLLAYGLCGKAIEGLRAGAVPLVIPRAHDCITLFLGGRTRYSHEFNDCPGTYWYVRDFIERGDTGEGALSIGANTLSDSETIYAEYVEKYGKDNADYLLEVMDAWQAHYERAVYIDLNTGSGVQAPGRAAERAEADAAKHGWRFERMAGDLVLIKRLLEGDWADDFLILQPGEQVVMSDGDEIITAK